MKQRRLLAVACLALLVPLANAVCPNNELWQAAKMTRMVVESDASPGVIAEFEVHYFLGAQIYAKVTRGTSVSESYSLSGDQYLFRGLDEKHYMHPVGFIQDARVPFLLPTSVLATLGFSGLCDIRAAHKVQGNTPEIVGDPVLRMPAFSVEGQLSRFSESAVTFDLVLTESPKVGVASKPSRLRGTFDFAAPAFPIEANVFNWFYVLQGDRFISAKRVNTEPTLSRFIGSK